MKNFSRNLAICLTSTCGFIVTALGIVIPLQTYATISPDSAISISPELGKMISQGSITFPIVHTHCPIIIPDNRKPIGAMDVLSISCPSSYYQDIVKATNEKIANTMTKYFTLYPDTTKRLKAFKNAINYATRQRSITTNAKKRFIYDMIALSFSNAALETSIQVDGGQSRCTIFNISCTDGEIDLSSTNMARYWKIYSKNYSLSKKSQNSGSIIYKICLASDHTICTELIQYVGNFTDYYKSIMPQEDVDNLPPSRKPMIASTISGKMKWKCTLYIESQICFNENTQGTLIMAIGDQKGEGFDGGEYDPKEILKAIGF